MKIDWVKRDLHEASRGQRKTGNSPATEIQREHLRGLMAQAEASIIALSKAHQQFYHGKHADPHLAKARDELYLFRLGQPRKGFETPRRFHLMLRLEKYKQRKRNMMIAT